MALLDVLNSLNKRFDEKIIDKYQEVIGKITTVNPDGSYSVAMSGISTNQDTALRNVFPADKDIKFNLNENVILSLPDGKKSNAVILCNANLEIPDEEVYEFEIVIPYTR